MFYALVLDQNEIMKKVNLFVALAPVAKMANVSNEKLDLITHGLSLFFIETALEEAKIYDFFNKNDESTELLTAFINAVDASTDPSQSFDDPEAKLVSHRFFP